MKRKLNKSKLAMIFRYIEKYLKDVTLENENEELKEINERLQQDLAFWKNECMKKNTKIQKLENK